MQTNKNGLKIISKILTFILMVTIILPKNISALTLVNEVQEIIINDHDTGASNNKFSYSDGWSTSTGLPNMFHNGDEHWVVINKGDNNAKYRYYTISFEGNKIELYGDKGPMLGKYAVSIDDGEEIIIDAYNATKIHKQKLFESGILDEGTHTLKVRGTGEGTGNSADMQVDYAKVMRTISTATGVQLSDSEVELEIGASYYLSAEVIPDNAINKEIVWSVEDSSVATVDNGMVTAVSNGTTKVIATVKNTGITAECTITVIDATSEKIYTTDINDSNIGIEINKFQYVGNWGTSSGIDWFGGDEHWSAIPKGSLTASNNYAEVKFYGNKIEIYGDKAPKHGIYAISIDGGEEIEVDAYSASRLRKQKIYESPILKHGVHTVKVRGTGKANINASEASIQLDYAKIYHYEIKAESIEMDKKSISIQDGSQATLNVIFNPENVSVKDIEWSSSDEKVVTVDENGVVLAMGIGEAVVTAKLENTDLTAITTVRVIEGNKYIGGFVGTTDRHHLQEKYGDYTMDFNTYDKVSAWRGDTAISKIVLYSKALGAQNIYATSSDLVNEYGDVISGDNVTKTFLKDVKATLGGVQPGQGFGQVVPNQPRQEIADILYTTDSVSVEANKLQQIWVEFDIPVDAVPGLYKGQIEVSADGVEKPLVFDFDIEVIDIVQPESDFHLDLWQYPYSVARYYEVEPFSKEHLEILKPHMELYKKVGGKTITTTIVEDAWNNQTYDKYTSMVKWTKKTDGTFTFDYTDFDKWVEFCLELGFDEQISAFSIVPWENRVIYYDEATGREVAERNAPGTPGWSNMWGQFLDSFVPHLDEKGWFDMVYIAMDERPINYMLPALDLIESKTNKDGHSLKVSGAMNYSTMDRNVLNRIDDISIHASHTNHNNGEVRALSEERRALGLNTTLYTCTGSSQSNFTRSEPSDNTWTVWYSAYHNTDGYLRWALDAWVEEPLEDTSHWYFEAGDTFLIYPGDKGTDNIQARSSVRLEKIAEAIRDVEKVKYMKENAPELAADIDTLLNSIGRYGGYGNGYGMNEGSEATKQAVAAEAQRVREEVARISREYVELNKVAVESVALDKTEATLKVGESTTLAAAVLPENATEKRVVWQSSNSDIATVENGVVMAKAKGTVEITAITVDGSLEAKCVVIVEDDVTEGVNKDALKVSIEYAEEVVASGALEGVVPVVVAEFNAALTEAIDVYENAQATEVEVDAAFKRLTKAIWMLDFKQGNKEALQALVNSAKHLVEKEYTTESWSNLKEVIKFAESVLVDENAMQEEIDETLTKLNDAIAALVKNNVNKDALQNLVNKVAGLNKDKYIVSTWTPFENALANANEVLDKENANQEEVDEAYNSLLRAYLNLRLIPDKSALEDLINKVGRMDLFKYTAETVKVLNNELAKAKVVFNNENATAEEVNAATKNLELAVNNLIKKDEDNEQGNTNTKPESNDKNDNNDKLPNTGGAGAGMLLYGVMSLVGGAVLSKKKKNN